MSKYIFKIMSEGALNLAPSDSASILIKDGWFSEAEVMWPGMIQALTKT
jgi:hypothetical protein